MRYYLIKKFIKISGDLAEDLIACAFAFFYKAEGWDLDNLSFGGIINIISRKTGELSNFLNEYIYYSQYDFRAILDEREARIARRNVCVDADAEDRGWCVLMGGAEAGAAEEGKAEAGAAEEGKAEAGAEAGAGAGADYPYYITYNQLNLFFFIKSLFNLGDYEYKTLKVKQLIKIMLSIYINVDPFKTIQVHIDSSTKNNTITLLNDTEPGKDHDCDYSLDTYKSIYGLNSDD